MVSIIAVTPCEIYCFPVRKVIEQMENDARVKDIVLRSAEAVFSTVYERYINLHCKSPQQRYEELVKRHPDLFSHFTLNGHCIILKHHTYSSQPNTENIE